MLKIIPRTVERKQHNEETRYYGKVQMESKNDKILSDKNIEKKKTLNNLILIYLTQLKIFNEMATFI